jgi:hypothetical protein
VSMSVLSVFVLSAFLCLFTALQVQFICRHRASSLFYMFLDDPGVCVLADYDPFCSRSLRPCLREFLDSIHVHYIRVHLLHTTSDGTHAFYTDSRTRTLLCCDRAGHSRAYLASSQPTVYISSPALRPLRTAPASRAQCDLEDMQHIFSLTHAHQTPTL